MIKYNVSLRCQSMGEVSVLGKLEGVFVLFKKALGDFNVICPNVNEKLGNGGQRSRGTELSGCSVL